jgi:hypothetical protein
MPDDFGPLCGWLDDPHRHVIAQTLPVIAQAGPNLVPDPEHSCLLYKCWLELYSDYPDYPAQEIGDCTSFGWGHGHDLLQVAMAFRGEISRDDVHRTCTEALYGTGRKCAGMWGSSGDGCYGSALAQAATTIGLINYGNLPDDAGPQEYSGQRAKAWGSGRGIPEDLKPWKGAYLLGDAAMITTIDEAIAAIQSGYPIPICSRLGFTMMRDSLGFCQVSGQWGHCMCCAGYRADCTGRAGFCILQSWGPTQPTGPLGLDQPSWSFWVDVPTMARILGERDSFAMSATAAFPPHEMPRSLRA